MAAGASDDVAMQSVVPVSGVPGKFASYGSSAGQGFCSGIAAYVGRAAAQAASLAGAACEAARARLDVNSPSRVTRRLGRSFGEGFSAGIDSWAPRAAASARNMAAASAAALSAGAGKWAPAPATAGPQTVVYRIDGMTYDDGSNVARTMDALYRQARMLRRS